MPNKNIKKIHKHPLIAYTIISALECQKIDSVVVSTNCSKIAKIAQDYGADVPFMRPNELAGDFSTDWDVINHYFKHIKVEEVAYLRPTSPLRNPAKMSEIIDFYFLNNKKCSGIRSMHKSAMPPYKVFKIDEEGYGSGFFEDFNGMKDYTNLPRQTFPQAYTPNGYVDICKLSTLEKYSTAFGTKIIPYITNHLIDVDTLTEFKLLDFQLSTEGHILLDLLNNRRWGTNILK